MLILKAFFVDDPESILSIQIPAINKVISNDFVTTFEKYLYRKLTAMSFFGQWTGLI